MEGNCGTGIGASISKPTPWPEKTDPFIYLIIQNADLFIYCPLIFVPIYCWLLDKYHRQFIEYEEKKQSRKISERKICAYTRMSENEAFHTEIQKTRVIHILFVEKRGPIIYLAALKKEGDGAGIRHAHSYYAVYRK